MIEKSRQHRRKGVKVTFSIPIDWLDRDASVVGDFNDWDPGAMPLRKKGAVRRASVVLQPGRAYAFRYLDSLGRWYDDPAADDVVANADGGSDCVIDLCDPVDSVH
jgi:1,4-alpha-glucan branching enzyme